MLGCGLSRSSHAQVNLISEAVAKGGVQMTKREAKDFAQSKTPSPELVRKTVEVRVSTTGGSYVSPGVAALSPHDVYKLVVEKVSSKEVE